MSNTVPGIGPGSFDKSELARAQESNVRIKRSATAVVYRLYTENVNVVTAIEPLINRYFDGATLIAAMGLWQGQHEASLVVEILATEGDFQKVFYLAEDIRRENNQHTVIVTWREVSRYDVTAE